MNTIWTITKKDIRLWVRRPGEWALIFLTPFLFMLIMGQVFGRGSAPTVSIYVVNEDDGRAARQAMGALRESKNLVVEELKTRADADVRVGRGERMVAVVIPVGFSALVEAGEPAVIDLIVDPAQEKSAGMATGLIHSVLAPLIVDAEVSRGVKAEIGDSFQTMEGVDEETNEKMKEFIELAVRASIANQVQDEMADPQITIAMEDVAAGKAELPPTLMDYLVPGYTFMFGFFLITTMAVSILEERTLGTFRRLMSAPASRMQLLMGKTLPYFLIIVLQITSMLVVGRLAFGVSLGDSPVALGLMILSTAVCVVGMGMMVASLVRSAGQGSGLASLLVIVLAAVSGSMFPGIRVPLLEYITPHYWGVQGIQDVITRGLGIGAVLPEAGILSAMGAAFFMIGVWRLKF